MYSVCYNLQNGTLFLKIEQKLQFYAYLKRKDKISEHFLTLRECGFWVVVFYFISDVFSSSIAHKLA